MSFMILPFRQKFHKCKNIVKMTLFRELDRYCENFPHVKALVINFAKFCPSEIKHVYSTSH